MDRSNRTLGILGGMGPEATALFFRKIVENTPADVDQKHLKTIIFCDPTIPDRTEAIVGKGISPVKKVKEGLRFLEKSGVDLIAVPCVTVHYFYNEFARVVNVPILNMIEEVASYIKEKGYGNNKIGILATSGTISGNIFQKCLQEHGIEFVIPDSRNQRVVIEAVYGKKGIKAGFKKHPRNLLWSAIEHLDARGAEVVLGGCTEIPIVISPKRCDLPFIDSLYVLALAVIRRLCVLRGNR